LTDSFGLGSTNHKEYIYIETRYSITGTSLNSINFKVLHLYTLDCGKMGCFSWERAPGTCQACSAMRKQAQPWPFQRKALGSLLAKKGLVMREE